MASQTLDLRTQQLAADITRDGAISLRPYQQSVRLIDVTFTVAMKDSTGTVVAAASNDDIILGKLGVKGKILADQSRVCGVSAVSGNVTGVFTLEKVNQAGTVTALTGQATTATNGTAVTFARATGNAYVSFDADDYIQLTFTEATAANIDNGDVINLTIAYISEELS
jgi:hypothetical protein